MDTSDINISLAAVTSSDLNLNKLNVKTPFAPSSPQNEQYKLTFFVEDELDNKMQQQQQLQKPTDFTESRIYSSYYRNSESRLAHSIDHNSCIISAFLYFITITTFAYLVILWIKQKMYVHMELMDIW